MKKTVILLAFLIFTCSSDDSSDNDDNSNQSFLERYEGVVWDYEDIVDETEYLRFNNDNVNWYTFYDYIGNGTYRCTNVDEAIDVLSLTLISNSGNFFSASSVYPEGDGFIANVTANNGGSRLEWEELYYANFAELEGLETRTMIMNRSEDDFPCD